MPVTIIGLGIRWGAAPATPERDGLDVAIPWILRRMGVSGPFRIASSERCMPFCRSQLRLRAEKSASISNVGCDQSVSLIWSTR